MTDLYSHMIADTCYLTNMFLFVETFFYLWSRAFMGSNLLVLSDLKRVKY